MKKRRFVVLLFTLSSLFFSFKVYPASFEKYAPKLLRFEGVGYGIHKPVWGEKEFSKYEALKILKNEYWNRYHGDLFTSQEVAEVFIDHLINAGAGKNAQNIRAFEAIIGAKEDGIWTVEDVKRANNFYFPEQIVNPYVKYRMLYYKSRPNAAANPGWATRAKAFMMKSNYGALQMKDIIIPDSIERRFRYIKLED